MSHPDSRLKSGTFGDTTGLFFNGSRAIEAYGKRKEMEEQFKRKKATVEDVKAAVGLLRIEARLKTLQAIGRMANKLGVSPFAEHLLTLPIAAQLMSKALTELDLNRPKYSLHGRDKILRKCFKHNAPTMLGILEWRARYGEDFWRDLKWSQSKYYSKRKDLIQANLWSVSPLEPLPALAISNVYNNPTSLS
jgi:hypothetical protein